MNDTRQSACKVKGERERERETDRKADVLFTKRLTNLCKRCVWVAGVPSTRAESVVVQRPSVSTSDCVFSCQLGNPIRMRDMTRWRRRSEHCAEQRTRHANQGACQACQPVATVDDPILGTSGRKTHASQAMCLNGSNHRHSTDGTGTFKPDKGLIRIFETSNVKAADNRVSLLLSRSSSSSRSWSTYTFLFVDKWSESERPTIPMTTTSGLYFGSLTVIGLEWKRKLMRVEMTAEVHYSAQSKFTFKAALPVQSERTNNKHENCGCKLIVRCSIAL
jgi:hypothetical protein